MNKVANCKNITFVSHLKSKLEVRQMTFIMIRMMYIKGKNRENIDKKGKLFLYKKNKTST